MHELEKHIEQHWKKLKSKKICVACSGGLDSICLTFILHNLGYDVTVIHVNYKLRGQDSEDDADFVSQFCGQYSIPFVVRTVDMKKELERGGNLQQVARDYRYDWFKELTQENEAVYIALAHHQDDQIETFLLNLSRKSGVMGLAAMPVERGRIIRPLLDFSKNDLLNYANTNLIKWREDKSNVTSKYRRNLLRNEIIPFINEKISDFDKSVLLLVKHFQAKQKELEKVIEPIIEELILSNKLSMVCYLGLDEFERNEFFRQLGQPGSKSSELLSLSGSQKGKMIELLPCKNNPFSSIVKETDSFIFLPRVQQIQEAILLIERVDSLPEFYSKDNLFLDFSKIKGELKVRNWQIGDRMQPVGMQGTKLISDIIAEARVSPLEKNNILVVHDSEHIHWCVGLKVGALAIANPQTDHLIKCTVIFREPPE